MITKEMLKTEIDNVPEGNLGVLCPRRAGYFGDKRAVYAATVDTLGELDRREPGKGWGERALEIAQCAKARDLLDALWAGRQPRRPLGAAALRARVRGGAVLEYFLGEKDLFLRVIRRGGIRFRDLGHHRPVLDAVASVYHAVCSPLLTLAKACGSLIGIVVYLFQYCRVLGESDRGAGDAGI